MLVISVMRYVSRLLGETAVLLCLSRNMRLSRHFVHIIDMWLLIVDSVNFLVHMSRVIRHDVSDTVSLQMASCYWLRRLVCERNSVSSGRFLDGNRMASVRIVVGMVWDMSSFLCKSFVFTSLTGDVRLSGHFVHIIDMWLLIVDSVNLLVHMSRVVRHDVSDTVSLQMA